MEDQENKDRRIGIITSLGVHAAVVVMLFFIIAWRAPNPPLPEFGIELNFGLDDQGSGNIQPLNPVGEQVEPKEETQDQPAQQQQDEIKPDVKEDEKVTVQEKTIGDTESKLESDVKVKEEKKEAQVIKDKPNELNPKEKVAVEYKKDEKNLTPKDGSKKGEQGNQGDDKKATGDKGNPEGKLDANTVYKGTQGGGGGGNGTGLQMAGWTWAKEPEIPEIPDNENGKVIFEIECDDSGEIIGITIVEQTLSPKSVEILKNEIRKNSLIRTSEGRVPPKSKGRFVFVLKTK